MNNPLDNFKNPWDADGEFAQSFLNLDKVLNVDSLSDKSSLENNNQKKLIKEAGFYYNEHGQFLSQVGNSSDVFILRNTIYELLIGVDHDTFINIAATAFGESAYNLDAAHACCYCIFNHFRQLASSGLEIYATDYLGGTWNILKTLIKMRNQLSDWDYAHNETKIGGSNEGYRYFLGINKNEDISFVKDIKARNLDVERKSAIKGVIQAYLYHTSFEGKDKSNGGIGWHGKDINANASWYPILHIQESHKKYGFENYPSQLKKEDSKFISCNVFKGKKSMVNGVDLSALSKVIYQTSPYAPKHPTGWL